MPAVESRQETRVRGRQSGSPAESVVHSASGKWLQLATHASSQRKSTRCSVGSMPSERACESISCVLRHCASARGASSAGGRSKCVLFALSVASMVAPNLSASTTSGGLATPASTSAGPPNTQCTPARTFSDMQRTMVRTSRVAGSAARGGVPEECPRSAGGVQRASSASDCSPRGGAGCGAGGEEQPAGGSGSLDGAGPSLAGGREAAVAGGAWREGDGSASRSVAETDRRGRGEERTGEGLEEEACDVCDACAAGGSGGGIPCPGGTAPPRGSGGPFGGPGGTVPGGGIRSSGTAGPHRVAPPAGEAGGASGWRETASWGAKNWACMWRSRPAIRASDRSAGSPVKRSMGRRFGRCCAQAMVESSTMVTRCGWQSIRRRVFVVRSRAGCQASTWPGRKMSCSGSRWWSACCTYSRLPIV
mmetsp:Transcript_46567/g.154388  ORF Transcript_46567/g.154388 Transcript_46567/m.154388 type:complete len:421 (+) Transcript_46567:261-1523(+)